MKDKDMPEHPDKKKLVAVIDCTPKWRDVMPLLWTAAANGSASAQLELLRCGDIADKYVDSRRTD